MRESGFSLAEVLVALVVVAVGLALAAGLLVETHRMLAQAGLELRAPAAEEALDLLRAELQGAAGVSGGPVGGFGWSRDRLVLVRPDGGTVVYEREGSRLVRRVAGGERTAVEGLVSWRWRRDAARLVSVEVVYEGRRGPGGVIVSPRGRIAGTSDWRTRRVTAALRGGGAQRGW
jgi:prepilin-type N-terminal cleavage/methylation domain-containing protein